MPETLSPYEKVFSHSISGLWRKKTIIAYFIFLPFLSLDEELCLILREAGGGDGGEGGRREKAVGGGAS